MAGRHERHSRKGQDYNPALGQLRQMKKFDWERQLYALRLDRTIKAVGFGVARFANKDGSGARPGVHVLMWACGLSTEAAVSKGLRQLRELGLIYLMVPGGGYGLARRADEYVLTTHDYIAEQSKSYETWAKERGYVPEDPSLPDAPAVEDDPWAG